MSGIATAIAGSALVSGYVGRKGAKDAARAQQESTDAAIAEQRRSKEEALGYFAPYADIGGIGLDQLGFLTDAQQQYDWLQNNPLFQSALANANRNTLAQSAAGGRLSYGDTLQRLSENVLLSAQPLVGQQMNNIRGLVNLGAGMTNAQANAALGVGSNISGLMQDYGNAQAAGIMGATNQAQNMISGLTGAGLYALNQPTNTSNLA